MTSGTTPGLPPTPQKMWTSQSAQAGGRCTRGTWADSLSTVHWVKFVL